MINGMLKNEVNEVEEAEAETVKTIKIEEVPEILNKMGMGNSVIIRWGNFLNDTYESKFMFDFKADAQEDGQIVITGKSYDDYEDTINEVFIINSNDVFDVYYENDGYEKNIHINLFGCGEYVDIEEQQ